MDCRGAGTELEVPNLSQLLSTCLEAACPRQGTGSRVCGLRLASLCQQVEMTGVVETAGEGGGQLAVGLEDWLAMASCAGVGKVRR